jgi:hypothetical protein
MKIENSCIEDHLSFRLMSSKLKGLSARKIQNNYGRQVQSFGIYTLASASAVRLGTLNIQRKQNAEKQKRLAVYVRRSTVAGCFHETRAKIDYIDSGNLSRPFGWNYSCDLKNRFGNSIKNMFISKQGFADDNTVTIKNNRGTRKINISGDFTINWLLFETMSRLRLDSSKKYEFSMLDHFDQLKNDQQICYSQSTKLNLADEAVVMHIFDHTGNGIVPWVYWVDEQGSLILAVSGIEAYVADL